MMTNIQRTWCENAIIKGGSFVSSFANMVYFADEDNFKIISPALDELIKKYPHYLESKEYE